MVRSLSRRRLLGAGLTGVAGAAILAACAPATPTPAPQPTAPAAAKPAEAPGAQSAAAKPPAAAADAAVKPAGEPTKPAAEPTKPAAAQAAPANAPAPAAAAKPAAKPGAKLLVWRGKDFSENLNPIVRKRWDEYSQRTGVQFDWDESLQLAADALPAAIQAGQPPDVIPLGQTSVHFWRAQGQLVDITDVVGKYEKQQGGFWQYMVDTMVWQGKWYASPFGVGTWPWHIRQDLLDQHDGGKWVSSWEEMRELAKKVTKPPLYAYGIPLGPCQDANHSFAEIVWTMGGKLQNDDNTLAVKENDEPFLAALDLLEKMYVQDRTIPEATITWNDGGNNAAYQGETAAWIMNPPSVWVWLAANKPDLRKKTTLAYAPKGPGGVFTTVQAEGWALFKASKAQDEVKGAYDVLLDPSWYQSQFVEQIDGRYGPVYKDMVKRPFWEKPPLSAIAYITQNGRILAATGAPLVAFSDLANKYLIPDMLSDVLTKKVDKKKAVNDFVAKAKELYAKNPPK
jgi:ABC-type glycerol-3-phosphate transport system substrate-binding protein